MTEMTTHDALMAAVLASPDDDLPRLVYADHLDERDGPGDRERAEFIRTQVELARIRKKNFDRIQSGGPMLTQEESASVPVLTERERKLWKDASQESIRNSMPAATSRKYWCVHRDADGNLGPALAVVARRGFVDEVRCTLADWFGRNCLSCHGDSRIEYPEGGRQCRQFGCVGGRLGAIGPAVVRSHPISRVILTDREPQQDGGEYMWASASDTSTWRFDVHHDTLPMEIAKHLKGGRHHPESRSIVAQWWHDTDQHAYDALSAALLSWAKSTPI